MTNVQAPMFISGLAEVDLGDVALVGGKGAALGEMTRAGFPVPAGFAVTTAAFSGFARTGALAPEARAALTSACVALGAARVAVRSSATAEDSASAAWAGQLDSFLNVRPDDAADAVTRCMASLGSPRALSYAAARGTCGGAGVRDATRVAVVVQAMVQSEAAGVAFSRHPVTGADEVVIEAAFGLGEAVVGGLVTPDAFTFAKPFLREDRPRLLDRRIAVQDRALFLGAEGNEWRALGAAEGGAPSISDARAAEVAALACALEKHFGFPCDVEWAVAEGRVWALQCRRITVL